MNKIKNSYEDGVCPDCGEEIPDDVVDGQECENCDHVFNEFVPVLKVWLDDERPMPDGFDVHVKTAEEAIQLISEGKVSEISLDHDLGTELTGYEVAKEIEKLAFENKIPQIQWRVHSQNCVGVKNIELALKNADKYWGERNLSWYDSEDYVVR